jgi:putative transposase
VFVSPSTLLCVALKHQVVLPGEPIRPRPVLPALPQVLWEKNRIWIWDATHFPRAKRVAYAIVDVVTRYWIGYLLTSEQTSTQAQLLFARALEDQDLLDSDGLPPSVADDGLPILVAWSDNGAEMTAADTREFMVLMAITQHHGRPGTPTDQAHIESFFSYLKGDWPHLARDPRRGRCSTPSWPGSAPSTTPAGWTPRSGMSPPPMSITAAGLRSVAPGPLGCAAPGRSGSSTIERASDDQSS